MGLKYDVIVIGGGPGGYPAAIRASQLGKRVAIVEERRGFGGECTLFGCIPSKTFIKYANVFWHARNSDFILGRENAQPDFPKLMEKVSHIVSSISSGIELLLKSYGVEILRGRAVIVDERVVRVEGFGDIESERIIIASGSEPTAPKNISIDGAIILDNRSFFSLRRKPSSMIVLGGGYVGVELSTAMAKLGVEISIIEMMPNLLPGMDLDASRAIERRLSSLGVRIYKNCVVKDLRMSEAGVDVELSCGERIYGEKMLVATGRRPRVRDLGVEKIGVEIDERGFIKTDNRLRTSNPRIYASGDVAGPPMLAHKAFIQAVVAGENVSGLDSVYSRSAIPMVVFSDPEIAQIGISVEEARSRGFNPVSIRIPLGGVARASIEESEDGFIKMIYDNDSKKILGFVIVSSNASELAGEASLIIENGMRLEDVEKAVHPHPTMSEVFKEVVEYALGKSTHYIIRKRR
ncbi:MAG: dihydrolipoyl dehydrogenase [Sulfolobales archaeon]